MIKKIAVSFLFAFVFLLLANQALGAENYCTPFSGGIYTDEYPKGSFNHCEGNELIKYSCVGDDWKTNPAVNCEQLFGYCVGNKCVFDACQTSGECSTRRYCATKLTPNSCEDGCIGEVPSNADACPKPSNFETLVGINGKYPIKLSTNNTCPSAPCSYRCKYPSYEYDSGKCVLSAPSLDAGKCDANDRIPISIYKYLSGNSFKLIPIMDGVEQSAKTIGKDYIYQGKPGKEYTFKAYEIDDAGNKVGATSYSCKGCPSVCAPDYYGGGNTEPTATITVPAGNQTVSADTSISFTGTGSDSNAGDTIDGYEWRLGSCDGGTLLYSGSSVPNTTPAISFPTTKTIYFKVKDNHGTWSDCDSRTITVALAGDPTLNFWADATTVASGSSTTLHWITTNASTCTATDGWTGSRLANGSESTGSISAQKTYTLECFKDSTTKIGGNNSGSSVSTGKQSVTISVSSSFSCTGTPPAGTQVMCPGDDNIINVTEIENWHEVSSCTSSRKCEFTVITPPACVPKCITTDPNTCGGTTIDNGCGTGTCTGTKDCTWREVAP